MTRLYLRQSDGGLTTALIPLDDLAAHWSGRQRFDTLIRSAVEMKLLKVNTLTIDEASRSGVRQPGARCAGEGRQRVGRGTAPRRPVPSAGRRDDGGPGAGRDPGRARGLGDPRTRQGETEVASIAARNEAIGYLGQSMDTLDKSFIKIAEIDLVDVPGMVRTRERLLADAHDGYHELLRRFQDGIATDFGPAGLQIRWGMGRAFRSLGDIEREMGDLDQSYDASHEGHRAAGRDSTREPRPRATTGRISPGPTTAREKPCGCGATSSAPRTTSTRRSQLREESSGRARRHPVPGRQPLLRRPHCSPSSPPATPRPKRNIRRAIELIAGRATEGNAAEAGRRENLLLLARYKVNLARLEQQARRSIRPNSCTSRSWISSIGSFPR